MEAVLPFAWLSQEAECALVLTTNTWTGTMSPAQVGHNKPSHSEISAHTHMLGVKIQHHVTVSEPRLADYMKSNEYFIFICVLWIHLFIYFRYVR